MTNKSVYAQLDAVAQATEEKRSSDAMWFGSGL